MRRLFSPVPLITGLLLLVACLGLPRAHAVTLTYPLASDSIDSRYDYEWAVLRAALEATKAQYGPFDMQRTATPMSPQRAEHELRTRGGHINILVRATSPELESQLLPVRLPVDRGLLGYRLLLIRRADQPLFARIKTVADLAQLRAGLGQGWLDVAIFRQAGIPVVEGNTYAGLFTMLDAGRFDFFSRSLDEATRELDERQDQLPRMAIEQTLLLHYPMARYFFLRRDAEGELLARRITAGMEAMLKDGTLNTLFQRYKGDLIRRAHTGRRRVITLPAPPGTGAPRIDVDARPELWFNPVTGK